MRPDDLQHSSRLSPCLHVAPVACPRLLRLFRPYASRVLEETNAVPRRHLLIQVHDRQPVFPPLSTGVHRHDMQRSSHCSEYVDQQRRRPHGPLDFLGKHPLRVLAGSADSRFHMALEPCLQRLG